MRRKPKILRKLIGNSKSKNDVLFVIIKEIQLIEPEIIIRDFFSIFRKNIISGATFIILFILKIKS